jgi:hypothetical protein
LSSCSALQRPRPSRIARQRNPKLVLIRPEKARGRCAVYARMDWIPIAELEPGHPSSQSKSIKGIVTLIWPFSSSTNQAAFLLADPDFRQRYKKGQVRVQVQGAVAWTLAKSKLGIGDEVVLGIRGARWVDTEVGVSTPGKGLDSELLFKDRISVQVRCSLDSQRLHTSC